MELKTLNSTDRKEIQDLLLDRGRVLQGDLAGLENDTWGPGDQRERAHSPASGDLAELASDASEKAVTYGQIENQSAELLEVRDALERLENGSFGLCDDCNQAVPIDRLRAIPHTRLCLNCKSLEERG